MTSRKYCLPRSLIGSEKPQANLKDIQPAPSSDEPFQGSRGRKPLL